MPAPKLRLERPSQVYESLREMIIRGRLAPGVRIVESDIAARLGVSRTPVREAAHRLFQEGFLVMRADARRTELEVAPLSLEDMKDLYIIMAALEGTAARGLDDLDVSARRRLLSRLREIEERFEELARRKEVDYDKVFELHNEFHNVLVSTCGRPRLVSMIATIRPQVDRYEWMYAPIVGPGYEETFAEHAEIIQSVRQGSGKKAQAAVTTNWLKGSQRLARAIQRLGGRGQW